MLFPKFVKNKSCAENQSANKEKSKLYKQIIQFFMDIITNTNCIGIALHLLCKDHIKNQHGCQIQAQHPKGSFHLFSQRIGAAEK